MTQAALAATDKAPHPLPSPQRGVPGSSASAENDRAREGLSDKDNSIEPLEPSDLVKGIRVPPADWDEWMRRHDWTYQQLARNEFPEVIWRRYYSQQYRPDPPLPGLMAFQLACICNDPVLWCEAFLRNPKKPKERWRFWDYQKPSIRTLTSVLHEDGAEVGKTREIIGIGLYLASTSPYGSGLTVGPMFTHVLKIVDGVRRQERYSPALAGSIVNHRKYPHHSIEFCNGFEWDFRPAGYDGEAIRSVHVETFSEIDEATKLKNPDIWKEYWRAAEPGCIHRIYSTPDGDRSGVFYRLCQNAEGKKQETKNPDEEVDLETVNESVIFTKFHWSKELMPAPFWTEKRRREFIEFYGGEDSSGYQQNVLGNWGDPENSLFPWHQFARLLKDIPDYRCLKILVDDSQEEVSIYGYELRRKTGEGDFSGRPEPAALMDRRISKAQFDIRSEIKAFFSHVPGLVFGGGDLGESKDPTELYIKLIFGRVHRLIGRVQLKHVTYDQQCDVIDALDDVFDAGRMTMGWGIDFGNAGSAVVQILHGQEQYSRKHYADRMTGYLFGSSYDAVDEEGETIEDKHKGGPLRLSAKELSSQLLVTKMQRQELEYPYDPDIMLFYPNHTWRQGQNRKIYKDVDDHVIDADRCLTLRVVLPGEGAEDEFACGSRLR